MIIKPLILIIPSILIPLVIKIGTIIIQYTPKSSKEKLSPFECGFDSKSKSRIPFSLHFFLLAILFIVFDVEIAIILILPILVKTKILYWYRLPLISFILILLLGILHEWNEGTITWKNQKYDSNFFYLNSTHNHSKNSLFYSPRTKDSQLLPNSKRTQQTKIYRGSPACQRRRKAIYKRVN